MWDDSEATIKSELATNERLLWAGRPRQGLVLRGSDALMIPFSIMWGGFAIFWEATALRSGPIFFALFGIPFVLVGLYMIFGRFFIDAHQRSRTYYGVTSERIVIVSGVLRRTIKSLNLETLSDITLTEKSDRSGTLTFGPVHPMYSWWEASNWPAGGRYHPPNFELLEGAKSVYETIRTAQRNSKVRS